MFLEELAAKFEISVEELIAAISSGRLWEFLAGQGGTTPPTPGTSAYADGTYMADGSLYADGLAPHS